MRFDFGLPLMPWLTSRIAWPIIASMMDHGTSIADEGSEDYLSRLETVGREYPEMVVLPGVEAIPFFYWKGDLWDGTLTLARGNEHIMVIGLESQEDFDGLPSVGNRTFPHISLYTLLSLWPLILTFLGYRLFRYSGPPLLRFRTVRGEPTKGTQVRVIRNGSEIHRENRVGEGIDWEFEDQTVKPGNRVFYRLDITFPQSGRIVTNPIFVTCS